MSYQDTTWNYFKGKNIPEKTIGAIMGNIQAESGFDPNVIESTTNIGYGLCQWSYTRRTELETYGIDIQHQLDFLWSELTGQNLNVTGASFQWINQSNELSWDDFMNGNGSIEQLTSAFCFSWERPNSAYAHLDVREQWANTYYNQYSTGGSVISGNCKLIYPFTFDSHIKISYVKNLFNLIKSKGNVVQIQNPSSNRKYYVNKSSIRML